VKFDFKKMSRGCIVIRVETKGQTEKVLIGARNRVSKLLTKQRIPEWQTSDGKGISKI